MQALHWVVGAHRPHDGGDLLRNERLVYTGTVLFILLVHISCSVILVPDHCKLKHNDNLLSEVIKHSKLICLE